jgi:tetratricopeptide (TPR) repeat protein
LVCILLNCTKNEELYTKAVSEVRKGNYDQAIILWKKLVSKNKTNPKYLNNLGWTYFRNDDFIKAKKILKKAKKICQNPELLKSIKTNILMVDTF